MTNKTTETLGSLQDAIIETLLTKAKEGSLTPSEMKVATELIRYHKISLDPTVPGNAVELLKGELPFFENNLLTVEEQ